MAENCEGTENCVIDYSIVERLNQSSNPILVDNFSSSFWSEKNVSQLVTSTMQYDNYTNNSDNNQRDINASTQTSLGVVIAVLLCTLMIIVVIFGNTLVILSVLTTRRLRTVTNLFVTSLAVADWLVGIFVMPPAVAYNIIGKWHLGWILCDIWISLDVLLCTASILSLCAISIDRYLAVTQPLKYSRRRRSKKLAMMMILVVWVLALAITCPPILGWYEQGRRDLDECRYNENKGYVVFSAMGSFFLPMLVMVYVYLRISCVVARRHEDMVQINSHQNVPMKEICLEFECESDNENRSCVSHKRSSSDYKSGGKNGGNRRESCPSHQGLVDKLSNNHETEEITNAKNNHPELINIGKSMSNTKLSMKPSSPWLTACEKHDDAKTSSQSSSVINLNSNDGGGGAGPCTNHQHCVSSNMYSMRSRSQTKSLSTRISSLKRESKTTRTLSIVMFSFIACWLPFFIQYLMNPFFPEMRNSTVQYILTWLGWINSAINPFIYAFYSEDFRTAFYRLTLRRFCMRQKNNAYAAAYPTTSMSAKR